MSDTNIDKILQFLIDKAEETGIGSSLTIIVNGAVITGELIKSDLYYDLMIKLYESVDKDSYNPNSTPQMRQIFENFRQEYIDLLKQLKNASSNDNCSKECIHLKNVKIRNTGTFTPAGAEVWRGKISSIDGFSIGITEFQMPNIPNIGGLDINSIMNQIQISNNNNPVRRPE